MIAVAVEVEVQSVVQSPGRYVSAESLFNTPGYLVGSAGSFTPRSSNSNINIS